MGNCSFRNHHGVVNGYVTTIYSLRTSPDGAQKNLFMIISTDFVLRPANYERRRAAILNSVIHITENLDTSLRIEHLGRFSVVLLHSVLNILYVRIYLMDNCSPNHEIPNFLYEIL